MILLAMILLFLLVALAALAFTACYLAHRVDEACQEFNRDHL